MKFQLRNIVMEFQMKKFRHGISLEKLRLEIGNNSFIHQYSLMRGTTFWHISLMHPLDLLRLDWMVEIWIQFGGQVADAGGINFNIQ
jgi:hypothetical protein